MRDELKEAITRDPLHKIQGEYARLCSFRSLPSIRMTPSAPWWAQRLKSSPAGVCAGGQLNARLD